jgi:hypothetical protein
MIKSIGLLKRKPGMSVQESHDYYETRHRLIGEKYLAPFASRYVRRFLEPADGHSPDENAFDVILEVWYEDQSAYERCGAHLSRPEVRAEIVADEEQLFDRPRNRFFVVDEHESELSESTAPAQSTLG